MKKILNTETIVALLSFLFLYTALSKYTDMTTFEYSLGESPILKNYARVVALILPALEIGAVLLMIIPRTRLLGLYMVTGLLLIFIIYLIGMVSFSKHLPCGCGGVISQLSWKGHIIFNLVFLVLSILGIRYQNKNQNQSNNFSTT